MFPFQRLTQGNLQSKMQQLKIQHDNTLEKQHSKISKKKMDIPNNKNHVP